MWEAAPARFPAESENALGGITPSHTQKRTLKEQQNPTQITACILEH